MQRSLGTQRTDGTMAGPKTPHGYCEEARRPCTCVSGPDSVTCNVANPYNGSVVVRCRERTGHGASTHVQNLHKTRLMPLRVDTP